ncbi:MAG: Xaa-Pro peptidase family protein [Clostridiales bacterium]|nr:Xaa-Pro peptidase family protein [Clostridiales bacterium]
MNHLQKIAALLPEYGLDALVVTSEPGEFYAVGFHGEGLVLVTAAGSAYSTDSRYIEAAQNQITGSDIHMIQGAGDSHAKWAGEKCAALSLGKIGVEEQYLSLADYEKLQAAFPAGTEFVHASALLARLRASKDEAELAVMEKAQAITDQAFSEILDYIKPGVTESEIAARLTYLMQSKGASRNSFDPIVASGPNGSMPHAIPGLKQIQAGEFVTMDFGCVYGGYCSDMTRTVAVGQPTEEMRRVYDTVLQAQLTGIALAKPGVTGAAVHNGAAAVLDEAGYAGKMGHSFGHSLGIEIHEDPGFRPTNNDPMPLGAVVSAEPGIYLPGQFGVRIEDVVVLTEDGCRVLTRSPKELIVL